MKWAHRLFDPLHKNDVAESFIWADGEFQNVSFSKEKEELTLDFTDYRSNHFRFIFYNVNDLVVADPVYCIRSKHSTDAGKRKLALFDDDGAVISFRYVSVQQHETKAYDG